MINVIFLLFILLKIIDIKSYNKKITEQQSDNIINEVKKIYHKELDKKNSADILALKYVKIHFLALIIKFALDLLSLVFVLFVSIYVYKAISMYILTLCVISLIIYVYYYFVTLKCLKTFLIKDKDKKRTYLNNASTYSIVYAKYFNYIKRKRYSWIAIYIHTYSLFFVLLNYNK
jgi:hypothetical protein